MAGLSKLKQVEACCWRSEGASSFLSLWPSDWLPGDRAHERVSHVIPYPCQPSSGGAWSFLPLAGRAVKFSRGKAVAPPLFPLLRGTDGRLERKQPCPLAEDHGMCTYPWKKTEVIKIMQACIGLAFYMCFGVVGGLLGFSIKISRKRASFGAMLKRHYSQTGFKGDLGAAKRIWIYSVCPCRNYGWAYLNLRCCTCFRK
jgi:hypothetical protein